MEENLLNERSKITEIICKVNYRNWLAPCHIALIAMWLLTSGLLVAMLFTGDRNADQLGLGHYLLLIFYVLALLWYLNRALPYSNKLPELHPLLLSRWKYGRWIPVIGIIGMLMLCAFSDKGVDIFMLVLIVATVWILLSWRREIRLRLIIQSLIVAIIAFSGGLPILINSFVGKSLFFVLLTLIPPMYIAGVLLFNHTNLGGIQLSTGHNLRVLRSFLWGCILFIPLGLFNAIDGLPGSDIDWVTKWWMPFTLPFFSGIAEETWFRLLLVGLSYFMLRPAFPKYPVLVVFAAVLISGIVFGLGHGRTIDNFLTTGLLYGLPLALIFSRYDWEHAVGAHYMINLIPWIMVFFKN